MKCRGYSVTSKALRTTPRTSMIVRQRDLLLQQERSALFQIVRVLFVGVHRQDVELRTLPIQQKRVQPGISSMHGAQP